MKTVWQRIPGRRARNSETQTTITVHSITRCRLNVASIRSVLLVSVTWRDRTDQHDSFSECLYNNNHGFYQRNQFLLEIDFFDKSHDFFSTTLYSIFFNFLIRSLFKDVY